MGFTNAERPLRILQIIGSRIFTGAEVSVYNLTEALIQKGQAVSILCSPDLAPIYQATKAQIIPAIYKGIIGHLNAAVVLALIRNNYEIIHLHGLSASILRTLALGPFRSKTIITLHGGETLFLTQRSAGLYQLFIRKCLEFSASHANEIVVVSSDLARVFSRFSQKLVLVRNGIDVENIRSTARRHRREARAMNDAKKEGAICLCFPGILSVDLKGQDIAIRSIASVVKLGLDARLFILGGGSDLDYLQKLSRQLGIETRVHFFGYLEHGTTLGYMDNADIVLTHLAGRTYCRGLSQVHLEAAALSKPIITAFVSDLEEFRDAMYFAADAEEVSSMIMRIAKNREEARAVGRNGA
ncbi:MAG: glycosyltransferase family 4 protein, partial [Candidatus Bathyarchaeia archaeon]